MAQQRPPLDGVFISYRRDDNPYPAAWLYANLSAKFGDERVFKDVDSISPGAVFEEEIARALSACRVLLAFIGRTWVTVTDEQGRRRLDDPGDFVRREIEAALRRRIRVIPVLIDKGQIARRDRTAALAGPPAGSSGARTATRELRACRPTVDRHG